MSWRFVSRYREAGAARLISQTPPRLLQRLLTHASAASFGGVVALQSVRVACRSPAACCALSSSRAPAAVASRRSSQRKGRSYPLALCVPRSFGVQVAFFIKVGRRHCRPRALHGACTASGRPRLRLIYSRLVCSMHLHAPIPSDATLLELVCREPKSFTRGTVTLPAAALQAPGRLWRAVALRTLRTLRALRTLRTLRALPCRGRAHAAPEARRCRRGGSVAALPPTSCNTLLAPSRALHQSRRRLRRWRGPPAHSWHALGWPPPPAAAFLSPPVESAGPPPAPSPAARRAAPARSAGRPGRAPRCRSPAAQAGMGGMWGWD